MSTPTNHRAAVDAAERAAEAWAAAVVAQRPAEPDHGDFYALAAEVVATLRHLDTLCQVLTVQVSAYGHTVIARGETLADDVPGHDPGERLAIASSWAAQTRHHLISAEQAADRFWSEVGHIAVDLGERSP